MTHSNVRWLTAGLVAGGCAGLMGLTSVLNAGFAFGADTALIMGSAFQPTPAESYIDDVMADFLNPENPFAGQPTFPGYTPVGVTTPETDYGPGLVQGVADIDKAINQYLAEAGDNVTVFGYSMSAAVATQELADLLALAPGERPDPDSLQFVLLETLANPNGGFFTRFGSDMPVVPSDSAYHTDIYNIEYSGATDFPKYALNLLAVANAMAGYINLHPALLPGWPTTFDTESIQNAVLLPTDEDGNVDYYLIPTQNLPLLDGIRAFPIFGPAMADLVQPALRVLIDLGYDRTDAADVITPVSWSMPSIDWDEVSQNLQLGFEQGWIAAQVDLGMLPETELPDLYPYLPDLSGLLGL